MKAWKYYRMLIDRLDRMFVKERMNNILIQSQVGVLTTDPILYSQEPVYLSHQHQEEDLMQSQHPIEGTEIIMQGNVPISKRVCIDGSGEIPEHQGMVGGMEGAEGSLVSNNQQIIDSHELDTSLEQSNENDVNAHLGLLLSGQTPGVMEFPLSNSTQRSQPSDSNTHFDPSVYESMLNSGNQVSEGYLDDNNGILNSMTHEEEHIHQTTEPNPSGSDTARLPEEGSDDEDSTIWVFQK